MTCKHVYPIIHSHMDPKLNEFKFSALRNFGSENISFTATIYSTEKTLKDEEIQSQVDMVNSLISKALKSTTYREIDEKKLFAETSKARTESIRELDAALSEEISTVKQSNKTVLEAQRLGISGKGLKKEESTNAKK